MRERSALIPESLFIILELNQAIYLKGLIFFNNSSYFAIELAAVNHTHLQAGIRPKEIIFPLLGNGFLVQ